MVALPSASLPPDENNAHRFCVWLFLALTFASNSFAADFTMQVTDKNYLDTQGFSVFLYDSTYHPFL